jgi:hypothetical protein
LHGLQADHPEILNGAGWVESSRATKRSYALGGFSMFGLFKRDSGESGAKPSLDSIHFDATGYATKGEPKPGVRVWHAPDGVGVGVQLVLIPLDLPANAASVGVLAAYYLGCVKKGGKLIEVSVVTAAGRHVVRTIFSELQQNSGRTFVGCLTLPFRDFFFAVKCLREEVGPAPTGLKEALLLDRAFREKKPMQIEGGRFHIPGWNPDDAKYDAEFPKHPVAQVRRMLDHLAKTLELADEIQQLPGFDLPS